MRGGALGTVTCAIALAATLSSAGAQTYSGHGIAMHGDLKYGPDFKHFDYVNPAAVKGGEVRQPAIGTFDSFNAFIVKGNPPDGIGLVFDTLLTPSADEPFSEYGLLAEKVETPADRSWVAFTLRPEARWQDGEPVTVDDVIFTFETLRDKGNPFYRGYYKSVSNVEKTGERTVKFTFGGGSNRELPLILGQLTILAKHYWQGRDFDQTTLDKPLGSGPYAVESFEPGRYVIYKRDENYWGKDLPVNVGRNNFGTIRYDYYRDMTVALVAFKSGDYDLRVENSAKEWATSYDFPALASGLAKKEEIPNDRPAGMQGFAFNVRRPLFQDRRVRQALGYAFDFEWSNKTLFYGQYKRTRSYFDNSELAATGLPSAGEVALLEPYRSKLPPEVFTTEYNPPKTDGSGNLRDQLRGAVKLLDEAGWKIDEKTRKLTRNGEPMHFEFLLIEPMFERVVLPFSKNLERLGIETSVRTVDAAQYQRRLDDFDFDVIVGSWPQSSSPGNEQREFWTSDFADRNGSRNLIGIKDAAVDGLVDAVIAAPDRASLVERVHALDRVLQWGFWVIPNWHIAYDRVAYWDKFGRPEITPSQGVQFDTWWIDPAKAKALAERRPKAG